MKKPILLILILLILLTIACATSTPIPTPYYYIPTTQPVKDTLTPTPIPPSSTPLPTLPPTGTYTPLPTKQPTTTITIVINNVDYDASCIPLDTPREVAAVTRVIDGDTIEVNLGNKIYTVRYIGINTPEVGEDGYFEATQANAQLVSKKTVILIKDTSETDQYDRLLRYVLVDGQFVNYELVRRGFAQSMTYEPDTACQPLFDQAQGIAAQATDKPAKPTRTPQPVASNCDPAYPDVCIPPPPPDLDCKDIQYRRFKVLPPDPHNFDGDLNGIGCENVQP